ncbi:P-loop containing nucleoside triphosphate hydrolase protein [Boletus coccyginus]|nr:P-loop containing nucleoside triphosphate hydrolase protein [Boletus coccyginus]
MADNTYTSIGSSALVAINPHKYVASNADSILQKYAASYRDMAENKDQSLIISGETGSGKSESRRLAIKTLLELSVSNPGKKGSKLASQVPAAEFIIESFGNARTLFNPNVSRFGKYTELQFTDKGPVPSGERNFYIFYYLMAGASPEECHHLHLADKTQYRYLGKRASTSARSNGIRDDDTTRFEQLKLALKSVGLSRQTCRPNMPAPHGYPPLDRNVDPAVVRNIDVLGIVAEFLGVQPSALESTLSYKMKLVKKELCTVFMDPDGASDNRDDLSRTLYSLLFAWLNEYINQHLCRDNFDTFIGLFDFPGPQNMTSWPNSLDQFCINFTNQRLQGFIQKRIFKSHVDNIDAGVPPPPANYTATSPDRPYTPPDNTLQSTTSALESSPLMASLLAGAAAAMVLTPLRQSIAFHTLLSLVPIDSTPSLLPEPRYAFGSNDPETKEPQQRL